MFRRLKRWLVDLFQPLDFLCLQSSDGIRWEPLRSVGLMLECRESAGSEIKLLGEYDVRDRVEFWRVWSAMNRVDVRWESGEEFAPLE